MNRLKQIIKVIIIVLFILPVLFILNITNDIPLEEFKKKNSGFFQVDGTFVHYVDQGDGTPLILLHGQGLHFIPGIFGLRD